MAERTTQFLMDENETMQTEPTSLSRDQDIALQ